MGTRGAHWYFTKEELNRPVRPGGLDPAIANKYRRATCIFIQKAGIALRLYCSFTLSHPLTHSLSLSPLTHKHFFIVKNQNLAIYNSQRQLLPSSHNSFTSSLLFFILDYRPQFTIATAMVYFHRFFARKDFEDYDRYVRSSLPLSLPSIFPSVYNH